MNNPYVSRGPVQNPELFFGRTNELAEIAAFLSGNQSVSVVGPRKIGKTSLLFHLMRPATWPKMGLGENNLFVYLDCEVLGECSHDEIFGQFACEVIASLEERGLPPEPAMDEVVVRPGRLSFERAVRKLNQRSLRLVLILDEFERLSTNPHLDVNFFNALRSAAGRYQLAFITASARPLIQLTYSENAQAILSSPFFNIFAPLFLGLLPENEARQLISQPARAAGAPFSLQTEDFILALVGGTPLGLQVASFYAFSPDKQPDLAEVERRTQQEMAAHYEYYWHNLTPSEQNTLRQISELAERATSDTTLRGILRDLVQKCLLVSDGATYVYPSRLWAKFISGRITLPPTPSQINRLLTGTHFGPYEVLDLLGRGGMAEVYMGRHLRLDRTVAIKILPAHMAVEEDFRARFEREARSVAALRHPNIVQVFDFGDVEGTYYMVMEYIAGKDLTNLLAETGAMALQEALPILKDLASALDYAHNQGIIHRDVKPSNILLRNESIQQTALQSAATLSLQNGYRAILTDFGIAKMLGGDTNATKTGLMMGTLNYMAPEQIRSSGEVDAHADIYATGIIIYQMLTGQMPFDADNPGALMLAHLQQPPADPKSIIPDLPDHVSYAILRALSKDPCDRFETAGALVEALEN